MNNKTIHVFEYSYLSVCKEGDDSSKTLTRSEYDELYHMESDLPKSMIEWRGSDSLKFKQFVGNIFLSNGTTIEILPKINKSSDAKSNDICRSSLLYMLESIYKLKIHSSSAGMSDLATFPLQDMFIRYFCFLLEEELHKGYLRRYVTEQDNINTMRGRLVFNEHLRVNIANKAKFHCEFDEFSVDNQYNRQLKASVKVFKDRVTSLEVEQSLINLQFDFNDVTDVPVNILEIEKLHFDRQTERFAPIFSLALMILAGKSPNMSEGEYSAPAMLFDMNKLFEEFIVVKLEEKLNESKQSNIKVSTQGDNKRLGKNNFLLKPDITIHHNDNIIAILDTKWKTKSNGESVDISSADAYQMYAYAHRYACPFLGLIYPDITNRHAVIYDDLYASNNDDGDRFGLYEFQFSLNFFADSTTEPKSELFEQQISDLAAKLEKEVDRVQVA